MYIIQAKHNQIINNNLNRSVEMWKGCDWCTQKIIGQTSQINGQGRQIWPMDKKDGYNKCTVQTGKTVSDHIWHICSLNGNWLFVK